MHDQRLEEQLRGALRVDGDALPFTITESELERRLTMRRRDHFGRRLSLLAAGVAVLAVAGLVGFGNGWVRLPAVGIVASPSPSTSASPSVAPSVAPTPTPTATPTPSTPATATPAAAATFRPAPDLGDPTDAILARVVAVADGVRRLEVWRSITMAENIDIFGVPFPDDVLPAEGAMRLGPTGFLAVPFAIGEFDGRAGVLIYDLADAMRPPYRIEAGSGGFGWGPDGRLALLDDLAVTIVDPAAGYARTTVPMPAGILVPTTLEQDVIWAAAGDGLVAYETTNVIHRAGVIALDGTWRSEPSPAVFTPTGRERMLDGRGRTLSTGCDSVPVEAAESGCVLVALPPSTADIEQWHDQAAAGAIWSASGTEAWAVVPRDVAVVGGAIDLLRGPAGGMEVVATLEGLELDGPPTLSGVSADDARLTVGWTRRVGSEALTSMVDTATGESYGMSGTFVGWADQSTAFYDPTGP
jgi:hypothetical protein